MRCNVEENGVCVIRMSDNLTISDEVGVIKRGWALTGYIPCLLFRASSRRKPRQGEPSQTFCNVAQRNFMWINVFG